MHKTAIKNTHKSTIKLGMLFAIIYYRYRMRGADTTHRIAEILRRMFIMYQTVRYEKNDNIAIVTINRPEALNALNSTVISGHYWRGSCMGGRRQAGGIPATGQLH